MKIKQIFGILNGTLIAIMVGLSIVLFFSITNLNDNSEWVTHTHHVIYQAENLMLNMVDQETGMRGYLVTGNRVYLEPYEKASEEFHTNIEELMVAVSDNPAQVLKLNEIDALAHDWHDLASDVYLEIKGEILSSEDMRHELRHHTQSGQGKERMDSIRALLEEFDDEVLKLQILNSMINMETGLRAFIINREEEYLEPYYEGANKLDEYLQLADDPIITTAAYDWITNIGEKQIALVRESLEYSTEEDLNREISKGVGKQIMDQIRVEIADFVEVEENLLMVRNQEAVNQYNLSILAILVALISVVLMGVTQTAVTNRVTAPLIDFSKKMRAFDFKNFDSRVTLKGKAVTEVMELAHGYEMLLNELKRNLLEREKIDWIQNGQMNISAIAEANNDLKSLLDKLMAFVTKKLGAHYSAVYILNNEEEKAFELCSGYALNELDTHKKSYKIGEGLVGQAAMGSEMIVVSDMPEDYVKILSGLGSTSPKNLLIVPCKYNDEVIAVFEIATLSDFSGLMLEFIDKTVTSMGIILNNALNFEKVQQLLEDSREANEKLQYQQEELRVTNEELENQSTALINSQSELEAQQENLRVVNEELEENSRFLEEQKKMLEEKNLELLESQKTIEQKTEDLILANQYKSEFLANMSHELRTPLNSILILSELVGESEVLSDEEKKYVDTINNSGKVLLQLINDILDLSKVEAGQVELEIAPMRLITLQNDMRNLFDQVSIKKNVDFNVKLSKDLPEYIITDEMKLKQIINNLLSNAFKFTEAGSVTLSINLRNENVEFEVKDTGVGISEDKVDLIFGAFKQEDGTTSRKYGGTGLGLSISAEYAKLLGGCIEVESKKDVGSRFILSIPLSLEHLKNGDEEDVEVIRTSNEKDRDVDIEAISYDPHESKYIPDDRHVISEGDRVLLIIDDDPTFARIVMDISKSHGFKVIVAETGEIGLYMADYYLPAGIILDIGLPGISGLEVLERLKSNKRTKNIPVNVISGKNVESEVTSTGIQFYQKPVGKEQIDLILDETYRGAQKPNKIVIMGDTGIDHDMVNDLARASESTADILVCKSERETLDTVSKDHVDIVILDLQFITSRELEYIEHIRDSSINDDTSIIIYTNDEISQRDERNLRGMVEDIIIKDGNSTRRLLDEITIFIHNIKESKISSITNSEDEVMFSNKVVMIVDDDMRNVFALSSILQKYGIKTELASNGKEALEMLQAENNIDLVLMDIMMPVMDGYEAMKAIRQMDEYKNLPVIALTAKAMKGDRDACIEAGANEYLTKPIDKSKLLSLLRVWI